MTAETTQPKRFLTREKFRALTNWAGSRLRKLMESVVGAAVDHGTREYTKSTHEAFGPPTGSRRRPLRK